MILLKFVLDFGIYEYGALHRQNNLTSRHAFIKLYLYQLLRINQKSYQTLPNLANIAKSFILSNS